MTYGVTREGNRGIPPCVTQDLLKSKNAQIETRVTSKEEVMQGDLEYTNLIEDSIYDTTPVHYISMVSEELKQVINEKQYFNVECDGIFDTVEGKYHQCAMDNIYKLDAFFKAAYNCEKN